MNNTSLDLPEVKSLSRQNKKLLVMLHGLGSDGHDLISLVPFIQTSLPDYYFISPHGIEEYDMAPFGHQWFSLKERNEHIIQGLIESNSSKVLSIINKKQQELGLSNKQTVLLGFSQGTMMASYLTLSQSDPFAGMVGFSGRLFAPITIKTKHTPICLIHGLKDDVVNCTESENFANYCNQNDIRCYLKLIPNLSHSIDNTGLEYAVNFLKNL